MLTRILNVLDRCLETAAPSSLGALANAAGLPKTTVWRIAESLVARGLLDRVEGGYTGGVGLAERGSRVASHNALRSAVLPEMVELHHQTGAAVWIVDTRGATEWRIIVSIFNRVAAETNYSDDWPHDPRDPAVLASALGTVAFGDKPGAATPLLRVGIPQLTPATDRNPHRFIERVHRGFDEQYVVEHGQFRLGWSCLALPIYSRETGSIVGVVGVVDRTPRFVPHRFLSAARNAATRIEAHWPSASEHTPVGQRRL